jgi:hypothetical protein
LRKFLSLALHLEKIEQFDQLPFEERLVGRFDYHRLIFMEAIIFDSLSFGDSRAS